MELYVVPKNAEKYHVYDKKERKIYSVSKKRFGKSWTLYDASDYALYSMIQTGVGKKPSFKIEFNDAPFMMVTCKSIYLDPSLECEGQGMKFAIKSHDRKNFELLKNGTKIGSITTEKQTNNEQKYFIEIEDKSFDDYIPMFAVCVDKCFSGLNK